MNSEDLFQSISDIDDDLIMNAENYSFNKRKRNIIPLVLSAAAAFILILLAGITINNTDINLFTGTVEATTSEHSELITGDVTEYPDEAASENTTSDLNSDETVHTDTTSSQNGAEAVSGTEIKPQTLSKASYPKLAPYPDDKFLNTEKYSDMYNAWKDDIYKLSSQPINQSAVNAFSRKITEKLLTAEGTENKAVSPLNVYMALSILAETAGGNSREQILSLLGTDSVTELRKETKNLWEKNYRNDGYLKSVLANSLWLNATVNFNKSTINTLADDYYASVFRGTPGGAAYDRLLNDWITEQTDGLITPDLRMSPDTVMTLVSTLLFNTKWSSEFSPNNNKTAVFHSAMGDEECTFMTKKEVPMQYFWGDSFSAINLPLDIGGKMWFILPDEGTDVSNIFSDDEVWRLITLKDNLLMTENESSKFLMVNLTIPKFDISTKTDLKETFTSLGITDVFSDTKADFSPLSSKQKNIFVNKVTHDVRVKIDEEGVSAAAYTAIIYCGSTMPSGDTVDFTLDRPFAFVITLDGATPLFTGIVNSCS